MCWQCCSRDEFSGLSTVSEASTKQNVRHMLPIDLRWLTRCCGQMRHQIIPCHKSSTLRRNATIVPFVKFAIFAILRAFLRPFEAGGRGKSVCVAHIGTATQQVRLLERVYDVIGDSPFVAWWRMRGLRLGATSPITGWVYNIFSEVSSETYASIPLACEELFVHANRLFAMREAVSIHQVRPKWLPLVYNGYSESDLSHRREIVIP